MMVSTSFGEALLLFIDGSVNTQTSIGYGAYLALSKQSYAQVSYVNELEPLIKVRRFESTSSTRLELQTLLWALSEIQPQVRQVVVHTDSQNLVGLPGRRERLKKRRFCSGKNRPLNNAALYRDFFEITDQLICKFVKVSGHQPSAQKEEVDRFFSLVDRAARRAQRQGRQ